MAEDDTPEGLTPYKEDAAPVSGKRGRTSRRRHAEAARERAERTGPERRCILSGERGDPALLVRLALGPDDCVLPDIRAKAPGRGAWIGVTRSELEKAVGNGKLKAALARAFKQGNVRFPDDLAERVDEGLRRDLLDRMGLESRASMAITGSEKIEAAARRGQVRLLLHAADSGTDGRRKLDQAWRVGEDAEGSDLGGLVLPVDRNALSMAMGRENVVHIAITDDRAANRLSAMLGRWQNYLGCANGAPTRETVSADIASDSVREVKG